MIIFKIVATFWILLGIYNIYKSRIIPRKGTGMFEAEIIDEAEDEIYDDTGGIKIRFFKVYRYEENGESFVVRSECPMRKITDTVGKKKVIWVDKKKRKALERKDALFYFLYGILYVVLGILYFWAYF